LQKKTFRSVNLLEVCVKIVEFIFKIIVHISRSVVPVVGPRMAKGSLILVGKRWKCYRGHKDRLQTKSDCLFFLPKVCAFL